MRILLIGASGDIGNVILDELAGSHEIIKVGRSSGDIIADITDRSSIEAMYKEVGNVDAVISANGNVHFAPLAEFTEEQFTSSLLDKAMSQINLVLVGLNHVSDGGSFTLTSGILCRDPIKTGAAAAAANGALDGFVTSAAIEMPRDLRINVVSPGLLEVSESRFGEYFPGHIPVSSKRVAYAYAKSVGGLINGQVITVD